MIIHPPLPVYLRKKVWGRPCGPSALRLSVFLHKDWGPRWLVGVGVWPNPLNLPSPQTSGPDFKKKIKIQQLGSYMYIQLWQIDTDIRAVEGVWKYRWNIYRMSRENKPYPLLLHTCSSSWLPVHLDLYKWLWNLYNVWLMIMESNCSQLWTETITTLWVGKKQLYIQE